MKGALLLRDDGMFEIDGRDCGNILEIMPILACPDRGADNLAVYHVVVDLLVGKRTLVFAVEANSELDAWLWMSLNTQTWLWVEPDGKINWEVSNYAARVG